MEEGIVNEVGGGGVTSTNLGGRVIAREISPPSPPTKKKYLPVPPKRKSTFGRTVHGRNKKAPPGHAAPAQDPNRHNTRNNSAGTGSSTLDPLDQKNVTELKRKIRDLLKQQQVNQSTIADLKSKNKVLTSQCDHNEVIIKANDESTSNSVVETNNRIKALSERHQSIVITKDNTIRDQAKELQERRKRFNMVST